MAKVRTKTGRFAYANYQLKRSILENSLEDNYMTGDYEDALKFFGGCAFCGTKRAPRKDHLIAVFHRGDFIRYNVVPACQQCDDSKGKKDYQDWMRHSNSQRSLKARGFTDPQIEKQIKLIERWQSGYRPKSEVALFGDDYDLYKEILQKMKYLCDEAKQMTRRVRARNSKPVQSRAELSYSKDTESSADRIRKFVLNTFVTPARKAGQKAVTVRAGDVHCQMRLHSQHANVCQAMKGEKFLSLANVKLKSFSGTQAGANAYFTYQL